MIICSNYKLGPETGQNEDVRRFKADRIDEYKVRDTERICRYTDTWRVADLKATDKPEVQEAQEYAIISICKRIEANMVIMNTFQVHKPLLNYTFEN